MRTISKSGIAVRAGIRAGGINSNHTRAALKVRAGVRAGGINSNHSRAGLKVSTSIRAGFSPMAQNHSRAILSVR